MAMRRFAFITVLLAGKAAFCSPPDACSLTSTVTDAKLTLSIPDGRTSFREGEIIPLVLSFTSTVDKRYRAADSIHDRSGRLDIDAYCLEPKARDPLADYFSTYRGIGGGAWGEQQLSEKPVTVTVELNEWRQPGPGHYRLYVVSPRVSGEPSKPISLNSPRVGRVPVTLRSNTIEFDVIKADAESRAKQLQDAISTYQNATADQQKEAARRLRFLSTKESTDTLARLFCLNDQPPGGDLMFGLFGSPYRAEAIAAMQREISSPDHPITRDFLETLTKLQIAADPKMEAHERELKKAAFTATVAALPQKVGRAHALTVLALATEKSDLLNKETASQLRRQLVGDWGDLPEGTRRDLLQDRWPLLAGPEMLPILLEIVSHPVPHLGDEHFGGEVVDRNAALKDIFELDPAKGRSLILRDLSDPKAQPSISLVKLLTSKELRLTSKELRPVVQQAVRRIEIGDARYVDYQARYPDYRIVELFGDESALGSLEAMFNVNNDHLPIGACIPVATPILRYFLRVDPKFGASAVQASLAARKVTGCYPTLWEDLGTSLPKFEQLAISDLDDADLKVSTSAARALGRWGTAKAEPALWARLRRFHQEWPTGVGEMRFTDDQTIARVEALDNLESTLVHSIAGGTNWICGPEKFKRLRALVSPQQRINLSHWTEEWEEGEAWTLKLSSGPEDRLSFSVLQYRDLDEEQIRVKLSQMPSGTKLYVQTSSPVSMEKQLAVLQGLRKYAAKFSVTIEEIEENSQCARCKELYDRIGQMRSSW